MTEKRIASLVGVVLSAIGVAYAFADSDVWAVFCVGGLIVSTMALLAEPR